MANGVSSAGVRLWPELAAGAQWRNININNQWRSWLIWLALMKGWRHASAVKSAEISACGNGWPHAIGETAGGYQLARR
jgi:hypothetical protein